MLLSLLMLKCPSLDYPHPKYMRLLRCDRTFVIYRQRLPTGFVHGPRHQGVSKGMAFVLRKIQSVVLPNQILEYFYDQNRKQISHDFCKFGIDDLDEEHDEQAVGALTGYRL